MYAGKADKVQSAPPLRAKQSADPAKRPLQGSPRVAHAAGRVSNQAMGQLLSIGGVQAKLTVAHTGDPLEREADLVANSVTRLPVGGSPSRPTIGRKCSECEQEDVQPKVSTPIGGEVSGGLEANVRSLRGGGQALPAEVQRDLQPRLQADLSKVRVHTGQ
jgi:hypothetical protein